MDIWCKNKKGEWEKAGYCEWMVMSDVKSM